LSAGSRAISGVNSDAQIMRDTGTPSISNVSSQ
jgi:hypothetical protein